MKKIEKLNKELFSEIESKQLKDLSTICGGNFIKYTGNGTTTGDKLVLTGNQDKSDDTDASTDKITTTPSCDMGSVFELKTDVASDDIAVAYINDGTTPDAY